MVVEQESTEICSNQQDWEARRAEIKMTKGFVAKESVKGHMASSFPFFFFLKYIE